MKTEPTYEVINYDTLNKFLLGAIRDIRKKEISIEEAQAISQITDKIIKNNMTMIMEQKRLNNTLPIEFFEPKTNQVLIG